MRIRCTQQTGKLLPVGGSLIEHQQELGVCEHHTRRIGQQTFLHILCNAGERRTIFAEPLPALVEEFAAVIGNAVSAAAPVGEKQIDLVDVDMGVFSLSAVLDNAVVNGVQHHQQAHRFQIFTQILNVKAEDAAFRVDIGLVGKYIQTAHREQLQCQRDTVRLRVDLLHQVVIEVLQRGRLSLITFQIFPIDVSHAAVNDRLLLRLDLIRAHKLLIQRHNKLGLHHQRLPAVAIPLGQIQRIDVAAIWIRGGDGNDLAAQRPYQLAIFAFGIDDNDVMVGRERQRGDLLLCRHRLARAGHAGNKTVAVEQISAVADDEVMRYGVDAVVNTARVLDLLRFERHENGSTFRGQGAGCLNAL